MELSMWILADRLRRFAPEAEIVSGKMEIEGVRLLLGTRQMRDEMLYIAPQDEGKSVLCLHGADRLRLNTPDIDAVLNTVLDTFEQFRQWSEALHAAVERGDSIQELLDLSRGVLPFPIAIADTFGNVVGFSGGYEALAEEDLYWACILREHRMSDCIFSDTLRDVTGAETGDWDNRPRIYQTGQNRIIGRNLSVGDEVVGTMIIVEADGLLTTGVCQIAEIFSEAIAGTLSTQGDSAELRTVMNMLESYLDSKPANIDLLWARICERTARREDEELELILLKNISRADKPFKSNLAYRIGSSLEGCFGLVFHDYVAGILCCAREETLLSELWKMLPQEEYLCGISLPFSDAKGMQKAGNQAALALLYGSQTPPSVSHCVDHAFMYFLNKLAGDKSFGTELLHPGLTRLKRYDERHGTDFYNTLYQYLLAERNVVATAKALFIHRNSMIYRLQRIQQLLDVDLDDPNMRLYLLLSYQIDWSMRNLPVTDLFTDEGFPGAEQGRHLFWEDVRKQL